MARPSVVWINTTALSRALFLAEQAPEAHEGDLLGARRALQAAEERQRRFAQMWQRGMEQVDDLIWSEARHVRTTVRTFHWLCTQVDRHGRFAVTVKRIAERLGVPEQHVPSALIDLEREPIAALTRELDAGRVVGITLTSKVFRAADPKPARRPAAAIEARLQ